MTRKEYMNTLPRFNTPESTKHHHDYMHQFVNPAVIIYVLAVIPLETMLASTDPHMNDIPLHRWDALSKHVCALTKTERLALGEDNSLATGVCIAKAAARAVRAKL